MMVVDDGSLVTTRMTLSLGEWGFHEVLLARELGLVSPAEGVETEEGFAVARLANFALPAAHAL